MHPLAHQFAKRGVDGALALDPILASEGLSLDHQREMAFAAAVVAGVAAVPVALVFQLEPDGMKRLRQAADDLGGDGAGGLGSGSIGHDDYIEASGDETTSGDARE